MYSLSDEKSPIFFAADVLNNTVPGSPIIFVPVINIFFKAFFKLMILLFLIKELEKITSPLGPIIFLLQHTNEIFLYSLRIETCFSKHFEV